MGIRYMALACLFTPSQASATDNTTKNSIYFIAAPYTCALQYNGHEQAFILSDHKSQQDLSNHHWEIITTSIIDGHTQHEHVHLLDQHPNALFRLASDHHHIAISLPASSALLPPLPTSFSNTSPLWIQYIQTANMTWHSPTLTPKIAAQVLADQKKTSHIAKRMAERAFYFGYDTNDDALE